MNRHCLKVLLTPVAGNLTPANEKNVFFIIRSGIWSFWEN